MNSKDHYKNFLVEIEIHQCFTSDPATEPSINKCFRTSYLYRHEVVRWKPMSRKQQPKVEELFSEWVIKVWNVGKVARRYVDSEEDVAMMQYEQELIMYGTQNRNTL
eukprot:g31515.t1